MTCTFGRTIPHFREQEIESLQREIAQAKELMANQRDYIKTLQDENLRLNKDVANWNQRALSGYEIEKQEALIAELVEALEQSKQLAQTHGTQRTVCVVYAKHWKR